MSLFILAAAAITFAAWIVTFLLTVDHPLDAMALLLYFTGYNLVFRPFVIGLGLDSPSPDDVFFNRDLSSLISTTHVLILLWFAAMIAGNRLLRPFSLVFSIGVPRPPNAVTSRQLLKISLALTIAASVATLILWGRFGGLEGLVQASKGDRTVGSRTSRLLPFLATVTSAATYLAALQERRLATIRNESPVRSIALVLVALNALYSFSWGARDSAVFGLLTVVAGHTFFGSTSLTETGQRLLSWWRSGRLIGRLMLVVLLLGLLTFGLRATRDEIVIGEVASTIQGQSVPRQIAIATNNTTYDALLLVIDEWPKTFPYRGSDDFRDGALTSLPGFVAQNPGNESLPVVVAQTFIPHRTNGWPITPVGDWYIGFGPIGVLVGGVISGMLGRSIQLRLRDFATNPLSWAMLVMFVGRVYPMGFWSASFTRYMTLGLPMALLAFAMRMMQANGLSLSNSDSSAGTRHFTEDASSS